MHLRDITFPTPQENINYDEVLLQMADKHGAGEYLRFWESPKIFVVLGRIGSAEADVNLIQTEKDNVPVLRRASGGGTVVQGPGCLNYTLVLSKQKYPELNDLRNSYTWISAKLIKALSQAGIEAYFKPTSDLATGPHEKKFSGNAQRRVRQHVLHHGTILYNFDLSLISRYLNMPKEIPEYRKGRPHLDFVTNVSIDLQAFKGNMAQVFGAGALQVSSTEELSFLKKGTL